MNLIKDGIRGIKWGALAKILNQLFQFVTLYIFAQILNPKDFGLMGLALVVIGILNVFRDLGISQALIQKEKHSSTLFSSSFYFILVVSFLFFIIIYFPSEIWAGVISNNDSEKEALIPVLNIISFGFLISGVGLVPRAILEKNLLFNKIAIVEILGSLCGSITGITFAFLDYGVFSLVIQHLMFAAVLSVGYWYFAKWIPRFVFKINDIKEIQSYSLNLSGFNIVNYFIRNADYILIGKFLGAQSLGYYTLAYKIMLYPVQNISKVISRVVFPIYSKLQNDNVHFRKIFRDVANGIAIISFPLMTGIFILGEPVIKLFFDTKWYPIIPILKILAPVGLIQSIVVTTGSIYQAKGRTDWMFKWGLFSGLITILGFGIGLNWNIIGVAFSYLVTNLILFIPSLFIPFKLIFENLMDFLNRLKNTVISSIIMVLPILLIYLVLPQNFELNRVIFVSMLIIVCLVTYIMVSLLINKQNISIIYSLISQKK